jgi:hypothetical protein
VVYPEEGLMVRRLYAGDQNLYLCGPIKTDLTVAPVATGYNLVGTLKSLSAMSLATLNLYTGDATTGLVGGINPTVSDNLLVVQPDGSSTTYFYFTGNPAGWRTATYIPADSTLIQPGGAFFIHRLNNNGGFNWVIPAE